VTVRQARALGALARAQLRYRAAHARAERLRSLRDKRLDACMAYLPSGERVRVGGYELKLTIGRPSERFRLADYRKAGGRVTRTMERFITSVDGRRLLDVQTDQEPST
jgi:hypothetical protein